MEVNSQAEVSLLIDPDRSGCYPLSTRAFHVAQATRRELKKNIGSLVLFRNGEVRRIEGVRAVSLHGESAFQKALSALNSCWNIEVDFSEPLKMSLTELKSLLLRCLDQYVELREERDAIRQDIQSAVDTERLFEALRLPPFEDCLDVL